MGWFITFIQIVYNQVEQISTSVSKVFHNCNTYNCTYTLYFSLQTEYEYNKIINENSFLLIVKNIKNTQREKK